MLCLLLLAIVRGYSFCGSLSTSVSGVYLTKNCLYEDQRSDSNGGAIYIVADASSELSVIKCAFLRCNSSMNEGAIRFYGGRSTFANVCGVGCNCGNDYSTQFARLYLSQSLENQFTQITCFDCGNAQTSAVDSIFISSGGRIAQDHMNFTHNRVTRWGQGLTTHDSSYCHSSFMNFMDNYHGTISFFYFNVTEGYVSHMNFCGNSETYESNSLVWTNCPNTALPVSYMDHLIIHDNIFKVLVYAYSTSKIYLSDSHLHTDEQYTRGSVQVTNITYTRGTLYSFTLKGLLNGVDECILPVVSFSTDIFTSQHQRIIKHSAVILLFPLIL